MKISKKTGAVLIKAGCFAATAAAIVVFAKVIFRNNGNDIKEVVEETLSN